MLYTKEEAESRAYMQQVFPSIEMYYSEVDAPWDCSGTTKSGQFIGELKVRDLKSYSFDTAYLELKKFDAVKSIAEQLGLTIFYFNVYQDNTLVWNLSKLPIETYLQRLEWLPKSSTEPWKGYEYKMIIHLPIKDAQKRGLGSAKMKKIN
jgi:hypothetical protein